MLFWPVYFSFVSLLVALLVLVLSFILIKLFAVSKKKIGTKTENPND
jgi:uncharacterized membrane protein